MSDIFDRFKAELEKAKEQSLKRISKDLLPYILENMHTKNNFAPKSTAKIVAHIKKQQKTLTLRNKPNATDQLYMLTGNLVRSLSTGGKGNKTRIENGDFVFEIDLDVIPYARIHEYGGVAGKGAQIPKRPYLKPGIKNFMANEMSRIAQDVVKTALRNL